MRRSSQNIPFYTNADVLAKKDPVREAIIFVIYMALSLLGHIVLRLADKTNSYWVKFFAVVWLIGIPALIIWHTQKKIKRHADELLKQTYYKAAAEFGITSIFMVLSWLLLERFGAAPFNNMGDYVITLAPYLIIWLVYGSVSREMMTLSGDKI